MAIVSRNIHNFINNDDCDYNTNHYYNKYNIQATDNLYYYNNYSTWAANNNSNDNPANSNYNNVR